MKAGEARGAQACEGVDHVVATPAPCGEDAATTHQATPTPGIHMLPLG